MKNEARFRRFLNLFAYGDDDSKRRECVNYIVETVAKADAEKKILQFAKLAEPEFMPNPCVDSAGTLFIDTRQLWQMYDEWVSKTRFVEIEVANLVHENYMIMRDMAKKPIAGK